MNRQTPEERARELFLSKLSDPTLNQEFVKVLTDAYISMVNIMPIDGKFSAARMAKACAEVALEARNISTAVDDALKIYLNSSTEAAVITRSVAPGEKEEAREATEEEVALDPNRDVKRELFAKLDEQIVLNQDEVEGKNVEFIDVLQDVPSEYLEIEGKRSRGLIDVLWDSTSQEAPEELEENVLRIVVPYAKSDVPDTYTMECPACRSTSIFSDYNDKCSCMDCDTEFLVEYSID